VKDPWTVHGGYADKLAVESEEMRRHYINEGLSEAKLAYTGALALDDLSFSMSSDPVSAKAYESGRKRSAGKTAILCALPPDYVGHQSARCDFSSFRELTDFWIDSIASIPDVEATFQLHPALAQSTSAMSSRGPMLRVRTSPC